MKHQATVVELSDHLDEVRMSFGDQVSIDDVENVVEDIMHSIQGDVTAADLVLYKDLYELLGYIQEARSDLREMGVDGSAPVDNIDLNQATDELDAVVKATEDATDVFLDSAEKIEALAENVPANTAEALYGISTRIFEASNFQDITGQRINKVVSVLQKIEGKLGSMTKAVEENFDWGDNEPTEAELLNGPGLPAAANSQDDIDALLASFD